MGRSARSRLGSDYQRLLADPAMGPLAQLPDGYGAKTFVTRLESVLSATTNTSGNWYGLFRPWNLGSVIGATDVRSFGVQMGPVIFYDQDIAATASLWYANNAIGYTNYTQTLNNSVEKVRFLCAEIDAQYIGPHGDSQTGTVFVNTSFQGQRLTSAHDSFGNLLTVAQAGTNAPIEIFDSTTPVTCPIDFMAAKTGVNNPTANAAYAPSFLQALPSTKVCPVGTSFKVRLYPKSVVGDGFYVRPGNSYSDIGSTADRLWGMVPEVIAESLPNAIINIVGANGGATAAQCYRFTMRGVFEMTPSYTFAAWIPGSLPPNEPRVVEQSKTLMETLSEGVISVVDQSLPYLSSAASAGVTWAAHQAVRKLAGRLV